MKTVTARTPSDVQKATESITRVKSYHHTSSGILGVTKLVAVVLLKQTAYCINIVHGLLTWYKRCHDDKQIIFLNKNVQRSICERMRAVPRKKGE